MTNQANEIINQVVSGLLKDPVTTMALLIQADSQLPGAFELVIQAVQLIDPDTLNNAMLTVLEQAESGDNTASQVMEVLSLKLGGDQNQQAIAAARYGAKLEYIKRLQGICPEGYLMAYFKAGGKVCSKCVEIAKCGTKVKTKKCEEGDKVVKGTKPILEFKKKRKLLSGGPALLGSYVMDGFRSFFGGKKGKKKSSDETIIISRKESELREREMRARDAAEAKARQERDSILSRYGNNINNVPESVKARLRDLNGQIYDEGYYKCGGKTEKKVVKGLEGINVLPEVVVTGTDKRPRFDSRRINLGNGYGVESQSIFDYYPDGSDQYAGDLATFVNRNIYYTPQGNDTIYGVPSGGFGDTNTNWVSYEHGYMPITKPAKNLNKAKKQFYKKIKKSTPTNKESKASYKRAKKGN